MTPGSCKPPDSYGEGEKNSKWKYPSTWRMKNGKMFHLCNPKGGMGFFCLQTYWWLSQIQSCALETVRSRLCSCLQNWTPPLLKGHFPRSGSGLQSLCVTGSQAEPQLCADSSRGTLTDVHQQPNLWAPQKCWMQVHRGTWRDCAAMVTVSEHVLTLLSAVWGSR